MILEKSEAALLPRTACRRPPFADQFDLQLLEADRLLDVRIALSFARLRGPEASQSGKG
jgi:hypothetical protein